MALKDSAHYCCDDLYEKQISTVITCFVLLGHVILFWKMFCLIQAMGSVNAQMNPTQLQNTLKNFEMESSKMDMKEEMSKFKN